LLGVAQVPQIEREDIEGWARGSQTSLIMPQVVRRLLWASVPSLRLETRAVTEWGDVVVEAAEGSRYCPKGRSIWAFDARSSGPPDDEPVVEGTSYAVVEPSRSGELRVRRANTRVLGADELARWLADCPAVAAWFWVRCLERPAGDLIDVESYLDQWSRRTRPPLPADLVLEGRRGEVDELSLWLRPDTQRLSTSMAVYADTAEEARVFAACVLDGLAEPDRERALARAVVVRSIEAWRHVVAQKPQSILLPDFDDFTPSLAGREGLVLWPRTLGERNRKRKRKDSVEARIEIIDPLPWRVVAERLQVLGLTQQRATSIAEESRGYLGPLQRLLGVADAPVWADASDHRELAIMLLLGAWEPACEADREAVEALGGDAQRLEEMCRRSSMLADTPLELHMGVWRWRVPADAWAGLVHLLYDSLVASFVELAIAVLGEDDPSLELPVEQRWMAPVYDKAPLRSKALRAGVADSLARLVKAAEDKSLDGVRVAGAGWRVLDAVLGERWQRWASLDELLLVLAEVDPSLFLDKAEASLRADDGLVALFEQEARPPQWASHLSVLQALEVLAWDPKALARTVDVLVKLAAKDPARHDSTGRWSNRPQESLKGIFHFFAPQTAADEDARFETLTRVVGMRDAEVGWSLLLELLRQLDGGVVPQHPRPRFRGEAPANPESIPGGLLEARVRRLEKLVLDAAGADPRHWADLFARNLVRQLDDDVLDARIRALVELHPSDEEDRLWSVVRGELHEYYFFDQEDSRMLARLRHLHEVFEPKDLVRRYAWLFAGGPRLPEPMPQDIEEQSKLVQMRQDAALGELLASSDAQDLLIRLVLRLGGEFHALGYALARCSRAREFEDQLLTREEPGPLRPLAPYLALGVYYRERQNLEWLRDILDRWRSDGRSDEALTVLLGLWSEPKIWDVVDGLGDSIRHAYWAKCSLVGEHGDGQWKRAIDNLLGAGNVSTALQATSAALRRDDLPAETLFGLLDIVLRSHDQVGQDHLKGYRIEQIFTALDRHYERAPNDDTQQRIAQLEIHFVGLLAHSKKRPILHLSKVLERSPEDFAVVVGWRYPARGNGPHAEQQDGASTAPRQGDRAWERRAVEELADVFNDAERATWLTTNAGFPRARIPAFTTASIFWAKVADEARNGVLAGGIGPILAEAAKQYPNNPVFAGRGDAEELDAPERGPNKPPDEATQQRTSLAYRILTAWTTYPGHEHGDIRIAERELLDWARAALQALAEHGIVDRGQDEVAEVLARPPRAEDGHWPCLAARELLESGEYPRLAHGLASAKRHVRGAGLVPAPEGFEQRERARGFDRSAEALRAQWPRTAELLDDLARWYQYDAERRDERARAERIQDGVPSQPSSRPTVHTADSLPTLAALHRLELHAVGPASDLEIDLAPRINLVVGDNGLGKTFLLDVTWWALTGSWGPIRPAWPSEAERAQRPTIRVVDEEGAVATSEFDLRRETWPRGPEWPRPSAPVVYVRIDGGISVWDPLRNDLYAIDDPRSLPAYDFDARALERGLRDSRGDASLCNGLIDDWEHWRHNDPGLFHHLFEVVKVLFAEDGGDRDTPKPGPAVQLSKEDETPIPTLELPYGRVPIVHLSAGMKRILGLAYALVWAWNGHRRAAKAEARPPAEHMIVLFDEIECHLHPQWQRRLLPALLQAIHSLADRIAVQVLATTHSPLVMASLETSFSERTDRLFHLDLVEGRVEIDPLPWANHGEVGNWLVSPVFGLAQPGSIEAELAIEAARQFIRDDKLQTKGQIDAALVALDEAAVPKEHDVRRRLRRMRGEAAQ
jgi:AAA domain, putative AbiEii toxin, Type IV TA system/Effector-associated domain 1/AAA domain